MALPPSGPLSIGMIASEIGQQQGNNSLRDLSNSAGFSTPDAISDFYGYAPSSYNYVNIVPLAWPSTKSACGAIQPDATQLFFSGSGGTELCLNAGNVGETIYLDSGLTSPFNGQNLYYKSQSCGNILQISTEGMLLAVLYC